MIEIIDPSTGLLSGTFPLHSIDQANYMIQACHNDHLEWKKISIHERGIYIQNIAFQLLEKIDLFSEIMAIEMGKPIKEGKAEIEKCANLCYYFAENAEEFLKEKSIESHYSQSYISFQPLGVILGIMPWNFPFWQVFRFAIPALLAGNGVILKHASNVSGCSMEIEKLMRKAGLPENLFVSVFLKGSETLSLIENPFLSAVTLTGSTEAGKSVAAKAGQELKKIVLELGGSDPYLILPDADLENAAKICAASRLINNGQSCIAAKRFIIDQEVYDEFVELFIKQVKHFKTGNPTNPETDLGPLATEEIKNLIERQVSQSLKMGAIMKYIAGNSHTEGFFYPVQVLTQVIPGMDVFDSETFGPVAAMVKSHDLENMINLANLTSFGLGSAIFTKDLELAHHLAQYDLQAGSCFINEMVRSDPRLPFGGIKNSGFGRELSSYGIQEFVNIKTIAVH